MESINVIQPISGHVSAAMKNDGMIVAETEIHASNSQERKTRDGLPEELFYTPPPRTAATATAERDEVQVRVLTTADFKPAAYSIALAFWEDHSSRYFIDTPDREHWTPKQKWDLHLKMMEYITYAHLLKGLVVSAGPNYDCVALWMPPSTNMDTPLVLLRSGLWRLSYQLSPEGRTRFFNEFLPLLNITKASVLGPLRDPDSWYLVYIGTRPYGRGKGYAKACIKFVIEKADQQGKACYLESSKDSNRDYYQKMGFEGKRVVYLQRGEEQVKLDIMVREPVEREGDADSGVDVQ